MVKILEVLTKTTQGQETIERPESIVIQFWILIILGHLYI